MQMRGVAKQNAQTVTMHHIGAFDDPAIRADFLSQLRGEVRYVSSENHEEE